MQGDASPNHDFILRTIRDVAQTQEPRILDFGCGRGHFVAVARAQGLDCYGVDSYPDIWGPWRDMLDPGARAVVSVVEDGRTIFASGTFDVVVANQVFEHISAADLAGAVAEVGRNLKPGGVFLALFPAADVWFEGHLGLYFPHWMQRWPRALSAYLKLCHRLGFGYRWHMGYATDEWVQTRAQMLRESIFHHSLDDVRRIWANAFGEAPSSLSAEYMQFRLGRRSRLVPRVLLDLACRKRAGQVLLVRKREAAAFHAVN